MALREADVVAALRAGEVDFALETPLEPMLDALRARTVTTTAAFLKSEARDAIARLRAGLDEEERELLFLRVDRGLSFKEIARVLLASDGEDDLARGAAAARKRFERVKAKLRARAQAEGVLPP